MEDYDAKTFGELHAETYDELHDPGTTEASVEFLAGLIGKGKALELAIGTGRVAVPLAERGINIHGLDASDKMLAKLKAKSGGKDIPASVADMADFDLGQNFDFSFLIFNTIFNLTTQEAQLKCFESVARHLKPGGKFLVETLVPDLSEFKDGQRFRLKKMSADSVVFEVAAYDNVTQRIDHQRIHFNEEGSRLVPLPMRYVWPPEMDLMARLAGLELEQRWGGWDKCAFDAKSSMHISLYVKN